MNHQDLSKLLRTVQGNVRCPQCGRSYEFGRIKIRGVVDTICFLELSCKSHMPLIATVMLQPNKKTKQGAKQIDVNDIIETHKVMKSFTGGFESMFKINK